MCVLGLLSVIWYLLPLVCGFSCLTLLFFHLRQFLDSCVYVKLLRAQCVKHKYITHRFKLSFDGLGIVCTLTYF